MPNKSNSNKKINTSYQSGVDAEKRVCHLLKGLGVDILKNRYKTKNGEIDIIALDKERGILIFGEVKCRKKIFDYIELVTEKQMQRIKNAIVDFLIEFPEYKDYYYRIDSFYIDMTTGKIDIIENCTF